MLHLLTLTVQNFKKRKYIVWYEKKKYTRDRVTRKSCVKIINK
jgi:hypothetical protein